MTGRDTPCRTKHATHCATPSAYFIPRRTLLIVVVGAPKNLSIPARADFGRACFFACRFRRFGVWCGGDAASPPSAVEMIPCCSRPSLVDWRGWGLTVAAPRLAEDTACTLPVPPVFCLPLLPAPPPPRFDPVGVAFSALSTRSASEAHTRAASVHDRRWSGTFIL